MHPFYHNDFINAIHQMKKIRLTFFSLSDGYEKTRLCAPLDFGPKRKATDQDNRYHVWDYESENGYHPLSVFPNDIVLLDFLEDIFDTSFVTWPPNWHVVRDWGIHS